MGKGDGRVRPGQRLDAAFSARAWNRAQDAADLVLGDRGGVQAGAGQTVAYPYTWVLAKNTTSSTVPRWGVLKIGGVEITPTSSSGGATAQFEQMPVLTGVTPTANAPAWCVAVEPIAAGGIGRVAVGGVVQAKVNVGNAGDQFVACGTTVSALVSGGSGEGAILWKESGTGNDRWALVRFGAGSSSLKFGKTSGIWNKGAGQSVPLHNPETGDAIAPQQTQFANNRFGVIGGNKWVVLANVGGTWMPIVAEC